MAALVDSGMLLALANKKDANHDAAVKTLSLLHEALIVPASVLTEAAYVVGRVLGVEAEAALVTSIARGEMRLEGITPEDCLRAADLLQKYRDARIGFVDASVVAVGERLGVRRLLTTDRRHFGVIRPRHCPAFEILP